MEYERVKEYLTSIGAEFLTEDQFIERWRAVMGNEPYMFPCGCLDCGKAQSQGDFTDVLFAIYPDKLPDDGDEEMNWQTLGYCGGGGLHFTSIGRCKFCGQCNVYHDY